MRGKQKEYPYTLKTDFGVRPDQVSQDKYGHFICLPDPHNQTKHWGFEEEAGMGLFYLDYKAHIRTTDAQP